MGYFRFSKIAAAMVYLILSHGCENTTSGRSGAKDPVRAELDYIRPIPGKNIPVSQGDAQRGQVLIAYSDCRMCHQENSRAKGPAFTDIAKRYPVNEAYVELLARKIILGGSGAWGNPVMSPHPELSINDARLMAKYILSLKERI